MHGEDDAATREYRHGDDLRRVHWRSTARVGELMVRREEQPWESRATVVLDTRAFAHRGEGPTASFEWAVSAAASIAVHLRHGGYKLRLVTDVGIDVDATEADGDGPLLDQLADVRLDQQADVATLVERVRRRNDGGLVIGVFGLLSSAEAELLAALRASGATCIALFIDTTTWLTLPTTAREEADHLHGLRRAGDAAGRLARGRRAARGEAARAMAAAGQPVAGLRLASRLRRDRRGRRAVNQRKHLTLVASASALLAALPLASVFDQWTWLIHSFLMVAVLCGVAVLIRSLRAPTWAPTLGMLAAGLLVLTWLFPSGHEIAGIIPSVDTFKHFNDLLTTAATEMSEFSVPVDDREGFLFLTTLGIGAVAIVIDLFAVVLRRPALAGLPMLAIYSVPVAVAEDSVSMIPFLLGAAGFLWLLVTDNVDRVRRFGRRFTGDGRDVDLWEPSPLAAAGQRLGFIGLALAVLLPLAWPGMTTGSAGALRQRHRGRVHRRVRQRPVGQPHRGVERRAEP